MDFYFQIDCSCCNRFPNCALIVKKNCSKGARTPNWDDVRTCVRAYVTLENIVHSISRGRTVTNFWNLVCVCNKYQWWYSDLNIPGNSQQSRFSEFSIFEWKFDYFKSWVALISIFRSITIVAFPSRIVHSQLSQKEYFSRMLAEISVLGMHLVWKVWFTALRSFKKYEPDAQCGIEYYIM